MRMLQDYELNAAHASYLYIALLRTTITNKVAIHF